MKDGNLNAFILLIMVFAIALIIQYSQGFKSGYNRCLIDAVENQCATIIVVDGKIKYEWIIPASATAELK